MEGLRSMGIFEGHNHTWNKWKEISRADRMMYIKGTPVPVGLVIIQERECGSCGKKELDSQEVKV